MEISRSIGCYIYWHGAKVEECRLPIMYPHTSRTVVLRCDISCHPNSQVWTAALHTTRHSLYVDMLSLIPVIHDISAKYVELPRSCGNYRLTQITKLWFMSPCWIYLGAVMPVMPVTTVYNRYGLLLDIYTRIIGMWFYCNEIGITGYFVVCCSIYYIY